MMQHPACKRGFMVKNNRLNVAVALLFLMAMLLLPSVSAIWGFDTVKEYDEQVREVTFKDSFLFIPTDTIGTAKLITPLDNHVALGYGKVAEFGIDNYKEYSNILSDIKLKDVN